MTFKAIGFYIRLKVKRPRVITLIIKTVSRPRYTSLCIFMLKYRAGFYSAVAFRTACVRCKLFTLCADRFITICVLTQLS